MSAPRFVSPALHVQNLTDSRGERVQEVHSYPDQATFVDGSAPIRGEDLAQNYQDRVGIFASRSSTRALARFA